jgi:hypothetical protein
MQAGAGPWANERLGLSVQEVPLDSDWLQDGQRTHRRGVRSGRLRG